MAKSFKYKDNTYLDTKGIVHNRKLLADIIYPVGSIYISANNTNPSTYYGGTWTQIKNRFLFATNSTSGAKGKDAVSNHTGTNVTDTAISKEQMPSHSHTVTHKGFLNTDNYTSRTDRPCISYNIYSEDNSASFDCTATGGGQAHNHAVAYTEVYVWQRIS